MKRKSLILLSSLWMSTWSWAQGPISPMNNFELSNISQELGTQIWSEMKEADYDSECFNRAMAWTFDMHYQHNINVGKVILHYSARYNDLISSQWGFHIAPLLKVENIETVFDKGFSGWLDETLPVQGWVDKFLENGRQKLIRKRKEFALKRERAQRELDQLRSSDFMYQRRRRSLLSDIGEANAKLREYHVTDADVERLSNDYILKIQNELNELQSKNDINLADKILEKREALNLVLSDKDQGIHFQCKPVQNIEEVDFHLSDEWCFVQKISMFYWGPPQLRLLNYGSTEIPLENQLEMAHIRGSEFQRTSFDIDQVWIARENAFEDYKSLWRTEYREREAVENADRNERRRNRRERLRRFFNVEDE